MKIRLIVLLLFLFTHSLTQAQAFGVSNAVNPIEHAYLGVGGVLDIPTQNQNNYNLGGGAELIGGYCFNDYVSIQTRIDNFYFYGNAISIFDLRPSFELKLAMDLKDFFQP